MRKGLDLLCAFLEWLIYIVGITASTNWRRLLSEPKKPREWWQEAGYKHPPAWSKYDGNTDRY